jgi:hypothetical protein
MALQCLCSAFASAGAITFSLSSAKQRVLVVVQDRLQHKRVAPEVFKHAVLMLRGQQQWLHRNRWHGRDHGHKLLRNALRVGDVGDHEPSHVGEGGDRFCQVAAGRLVEVEEQRQVVPLTQLIPDCFRYNLSLFVKILN